METGNAILFIGLLVISLGLTACGFALHRGSLALIGMGFWMITAVFCRIESAGAWNIYMGMFWLSIGMMFVSGIDGALILSKGEEQAEDEAEYTSALDEAFKDMDLSIEERRNRRRRR